MILDGKYIIFKKEQIYPILDILYNLGYKWSLHTNEEYSKILYNRYPKFCCIISDGYRLKVSKIDDCIEHNKEKLDVNILLREKKLKRILK